MMFEIPGRPQPKARPRFGNGHAYTPEKTAEYERLVGFCYRQAGGKLSEGPVDLHITAFFPIPQSTPKGRVEQMASGYIRHTVKPDVDNLAKSILDGLNGVAFRDDKQVWRLALEKRYGQEPKVVVRIAEG